jgi:Fusaric acid resistance protein-like
MTAGLIAGAATSGHFWVSLLLIALAAFAAAWVSDLHRVLDVTLRSSQPRRFEVGRARSDCSSVPSGRRRVRMPGRALASPHTPVRRASTLTHMERRAAPAAVGAIHRRAAVRALLHRRRHGRRRCNPSAGRPASAFWVTITALLVMRPDGPKSLELTCQRFGGTVGGIALVALAVVFGHKTLGADRLGIAARLLCSYRLEPQLRARGRTHHCEGHGATQSRAAAGRRSALAVGAAAGHGPGLRTCPVRNGGRRPGGTEKAIPCGRSAACRLTPCMGTQTAVKLPLPKSTRVASCTCRASKSRSGT